MIDRLLSEPPLIEFLGVTLVTLGNIADRLTHPLSVRRSVGLKSPLCFGLCGTLGAGKTQFARELARGLGVDPTSVTSPTFSLLRSYVTDSVCLHHLDAYRIADENEFLDLGIEEILSTPNTWTVIEWADRFDKVLPPEAVWVKIEPQMTPEVTTDFESARSVERQVKFWCQDPACGSWLLDCLSS